MTCALLFAVLSLATPLAPAETRESAASAPMPVPAQEPDGPENLRRLMADAAPAIAAFRAARARHDAPACAKLEPGIRALDRAAHQRDAYAAGLYWHTDLEEAKRAAAREGKPILSLRLLGRLDEECSCANSRFFRTALYANQAVAGHLRAHFVLHWQSVRPVPKITIDMGDGRRMERTLTGNSIHYILDANGRVIDALPGLYGPAVFLAQLKTDGAQAALAAGWNDADFRRNMAAWHSAKRQALETQWAAMWPPPSKTTPLWLSLSPAKAGLAETTPTAARAAPVAKGKMLIEAPVLDRIGLAVSPDAAGDEAWEKAAAPFAPGSRLDDSSRGLMREKASAAMARQAMLAAISKRAVEDPMMRSIRAFESSLAKDTAQNELRFHRTLHVWLAENPSVALDAFNRRVYADLFLTPDGDPWLGLAPADTYAALDDEGLVVPAK